MWLQGQGMHDDGSMDPDDDLAGDDGKSDDMTNVFHGAHAHMLSIPHNSHQMGQPVPGQPLAHHVLAWCNAMNCMKLGFQHNILHCWQCAGVQDNCFEHTNGDHSQHMTWKLLLVSCSCYGEDLPAEHKACCSNDCTSMIVDVCGLQVGCQTHM